MAAHLRRLRWAVRSTLALGVAASVAANVLHARPNPISQIIAAWPPLALLLTVELISRVPHHRRFLGAIRIAATAVIAGIATWVSYWHLAGVAARYGETEHGAAFLLPISVDGLVIVASVSLVELTARIRAATSAKVAAAPVISPLATALEPVGPPATAAKTAAAPSSASIVPVTTGTPANGEPAAAVTTVPGAADDIVVGHPAAGAGERSRLRRSAPSLVPHTRTAKPTAMPEHADGVPAHASHPFRDERDEGLRAPSGDNGPNETPAPRMPSEPAPRSRSSDGRWHDDAAPGTLPSADGGGDDSVVPADGAGERPADDVPADTAAAVAYWRRRAPHLHPADIARRIGKSERTVRRYLSRPATNGTTRVERLMTDNRRQ
ncbi:DUF2637 domain-containing protein [Micromonospora sp. MP36]|nr:DUF2637 domain-containing protein [Micromonospora sp. DR5-3]TYC19343.1 DUF2637 domain-containing protein [Micromonospora sp. MP36]